MMSQIKLSRALAPMVSFFVQSLYAVINHHGVTPVYVHAV